MTAPLRLFELGGPWEVVGRTDGIVCALADRHYTRRPKSRGCGQVGGNGRTLVLRSADHLAGWISFYTKNWLTYVDTAKVESRNPGYCFKAAGWWRDRSYQPDRRRASLIRLRATA